MVAGQRSPLPAAPWPCPCVYMWGMLGLGFRYAPGFRLKASKCRDGLQMHGPACSPSHRLRWAQVLQAALRTPPPSRNPSDHLAQGTASLEAPGVAASGGSALSSPGAAVSLELAWLPGEPIDDSASMTGGRRSRSEGERSGQSPGERVLRKVEIVRGPDVQSPFARAQLQDGE